MQLNIGYLTPEYVLPGSPEGGIANYVRKVASAMADRQHRVVVFTLSSDNNHWKDGKVEIVEVKVVLRPSIPNFFKGQLDRFLPVYSRLRSAKRIERAVWKYHRSSPLDLLHVSNYAAPGFTLRHNGRIPMVCFVCSYTPLWRSAGGQCPNLGEYLSDWLEVRQMLDADSVYAPSKFIAQEIFRYNHFQPAVIHDPPDMCKYETDLSFYQSELSRFPYLLFFSSLSKIKGVDLVADAISNVFQKHPGMHLVLIGRDYGMPLYPKAMDYVLEKCHAVRDRIHYYPPLPKTQLLPVIANSSGVLMPSRVDNYPNACIEALSQGSVVIGTRNSSLDEMIQDGETGLLVTNGDAQSLEHAIDHLLRMPQEEIMRIKTNILNTIQAIQQENRIADLENLYFKTISSVRK